MSYAIDDQPIGLHNPTDTWGNDEFAFSPGLVFLYAPWCGHCQHAKTEFHVDRLKDEFGTMFRMHDASNNSESVDNYVNDLSITLDEAKKLGLGVNSSTGSKYVDGYPTIFVITKNGNVQPYMGERDYATAKMTIAQYCL